MKKKIMLAVDDSKNSTQAIDYAVRISSKIRNLHYSLFNIQSMISIYMQDEAKESPAAKSELTQIQEQMRKNRKPF